MQPTEHRSFIDDMDREVNLLIYPPNRVISLCPSITETLIELGVNVVGRTKFCIHPKEKISQISVVGGTKKVNFDKIISLNPDLIIAEKEENTPEIVFILEKHFPVYVVNIETWEDGINMIVRLGDLVGQTEGFLAISKQLEKINFPKISKSQRVAYLIWKKPYMSVGNRTFIHSVLSKLGFENVFASAESRYPEFEIKELHALMPDLILFSSEPYPFKEKDLEELKQFMPSARMKLVDGEMFSWYGIRMLKALNYFEQELQAWEG